MITTPRQTLQWTPPTLSTRLDWKAPATAMLWLRQQTTTWTGEFLWRSKATEDSGSTATIAWLREMDRWLILEAEDLRVSVVPATAIMLATARPASAMLAMVGLFMLTGAMLELEVGVEEEEGEVLVPLEVMVVVLEV